MSPGVVHQLSATWNYTRSPRIFDRGGPDPIAVYILGHASIDIGGTMATDSTVEYWEEYYIKKYMGDCFETTYLSPVDTSILYDGLDSLKIKVAGETTGVDSMAWFQELPEPDLRCPFGDIVSKIIISEFN